MIQLIIVYDITGLPSCELTERPAEILIVFEVCQSIEPIVKHSCPDQCEDDGITKCCIATYATNATKIECNISPGVTDDHKYLDSIDCTCVPCG